MHADRRPASNTVAGGNGDAITAAEDATSLWGRDLGAVGDGSQHIGPAAEASEGTAEAEHGDILRAAGQADANEVSDAVNWAVVSWQQNCFS